MGTVILISGYNQRSFYFFRFKAYAPGVPANNFTNFQRTYRIFLQNYNNQTKPAHAVLEKDTKHINIVNKNMNNDKTCVSKKTDLPEKSSTQSSIIEEERKQTSSESVTNSPLNECTTCSEKFGSLELLNEHVKNAHQSSNSVEENADSLNIPQPEETKMAKDQVVKSLDCKICSKKFRLQESYRAHMRLHTGERPLTCHVCGKQFGQSGSLYYHLKHVHDGVKNHSCDICGRSFAMKTAMEDHRRIHTGERPYVCDSCGKTFKTKASLYIHGKTHTNVFPHKCTYCTKAFRWRQQMLGHLTTHTGEKNFTCDTCGKGFGVRNDLTRHKRIHSKEKPYTCQQCAVSFAQKRYLKSHERTRHN